VSDVKILMTHKLLSMFEAAKISPYDQEYLSLLSRRGILRAQKIGKKWYTTPDWLNEYLKEKKPNEMITEDSLLKLKGGRRKTETLSGRKLIFIWGISLLVVSTISFFAYQRIFEQVNVLEEKSKQMEFIPEEIIKIPNEEGNLNIYGTGRIKIGEEKVRNLPTE